MLAGSANADKVLLQNDFGPDADIGPSLVVGSNNNEVNSTSNAATGLIRYEDPVADGTASVGLTSATRVDVTDVANSTGFRVDWVVESSTTSANTFFNGWFFGVQAAPSALWNTGSGGAAGFALGRINTGVAGEPSFVQNTASNVRTNVDIGDAPTVADMDDGFTVAFTLMDDNSWTITTTGLGGISGSGFLQPNLTYASLASNAYASTFFQGNEIDGSPTPLAGDIQYGSVTVTALAVPEPSIALFGTFGLLGTLVRRRRS